MQQPTLVVLAAGMGSRFGGLKQIAAVDEYGHAIIDFSLYDAYRAGFRKVAFIIKHEIEEDFKRVIGSRMEKYFDVKYVYQQLDMLPEGFSVPEGRVKPWGTGHAVLCCDGIVEGPFAVINADDFYGRGAYETIYKFLTAERPDTEHSMLGYQLSKTVTENGTVARGVCQVENGFLTDIVERTKIKKDGDNAAFTEDGETWNFLDGSTPVSMNFWGYGASMLRELKARFPKWLEKTLLVNPLKGEFFLPLTTNDIIKEGIGTVQVLDCGEKWYGITYKEDMPDFVAHIKELQDSGAYPIAMLE